MTKFSNIKLPIGMWSEGLYRRLTDKMGPVGKGIYYDVFELLRTGGGKVPLYEVLSIYKGLPNSHLRAQLNKHLRYILSDNCGLFRTDDQGRVSIIHPKAT